MPSTAGTNNHLGTGTTYLYRGLFVGRQRTSLCEVTRQAAKGSGSAMGMVLTEYGQYAYDHEGYVAEVLDDGSLTRTASSDTVPRMVGQMVAACGCGWTGKTRYPTKSPFDHRAEELALAEWERNHARPALDSGRVKNWDRLCAVLRSAPTSSTTGRQFTALSQQQQIDILNETLRVLRYATDLARRLRDPD
jgi:hypothetical protein